MNPQNLVTVSGNKSESIKSESKRITCFCHDFELSKLTIFSNLIKWTGTRQFWTSGFNLKMVFNFKSNRLQGVDIEPKEPSGPALHSDCTCVATVAIPSCCLRHRDLSRLSSKCIDLGSFSLQGIMGGFTWCTLCLWSEFSIHQFLQGKSTCVNP